MRAHVGERKNETLESIEEATGVLLSDGAWNALAGLTILQMLDVDAYMREVILVNIHDSRQSE
jgi:hypothetical protein